MQGTTLRRLVMLLLVLALVATACRADDDATDDVVADDPAEPGPGDDETDTDDMAIATDIGVTDEPCPDAVNEDNGCIYLGIISDLTVGPFAALAVPLTDAQAAFWRRVNENGGIGGYDIDATTYVRDNEYNPEVHVRVFEEIRGDVLALAQTLGSPQTAAIMDDLRAEDIVAAPASWTSSWDFEDIIVASGANYCFEAMNGVDFVFEQNENIETVMAVHYPGDYGDDAAYGVQVAAEANGAEFINVETPQGADNQAEAIQAVVSQQPDLVYITTGPLEMATIVGQAAAQGFQGQFMGSGPTWNPGLLDSPAADALQAMYLQSGPWLPFGADTPGHEAMREYVGDVTPNDGYTSGWIWQYPLLAAIEAAVDRGDLTRAGLRAALEDLDSVDYEGMLPDEAGDFSPGDPNETAFRQSTVGGVNPDEPSGIETLRDYFVGPTAEEYDLTGPCYQQL